MTETEIANLALDHIGDQASLVSLADTTKAGRACSRNYAASRRSVIAMHPWKFAITRVVLAPDTATPAFEFSQQYTTPGNLVNVIYVNDYDSEWRREGAKILCNYPSINLKYVFDNDNTSMFPPLFCDMLALHLASKICFSLTQSNERLADIVKELSAANNKAKFSDSVDDSIRHVIADEYINVRIGPNRGFVRDPMT